MYQFHFQLTLIKERGERARSTDKNPTKPWTNPVVLLPPADFALAVHDRTLPLSPPNVPHLSPNLVLLEMLSFSVVPRRGGPSIYPHHALLGLNNLPPWTLPVLLLAPLRSPPSLPLCKSLHLKELATGIVLQ